MMRLILSILFFTLLALPLQAEPKRTAFMLGFERESIEGLESSNNLSLRTHTTLYNKNKSGWMVHLDWYNHWLYPDAFVGYGTRKGGKYFFEAAGAAGFSLLDGPGAAGFLQVGAELGGGWFITLPVTYKLGRSLDSYFLIGFTW